jgi:hypothetical protein
MDREPIRDDLLEAMEACRPGGEDLRDPAFSALAERLANDPELAQRFDRMQRADAAVKAAFQDEPVPGGLAGRISAGLTAARARARVDAGQVSQLAEVQPTDSPATLESRPTPAASWETYPAPQQKRFSRRGLFIGAAASVMAATVLLAMIFGFKAQHAITRDQILQTAAQLFDTEPREAGQLLAEVSPPADYPFSREVIQVRGTQWRWVKEDLLENRAVAFDLPGPPGARATLYALKRSVPGLPAEAPPLPQLSTNGRSAAAWQSEGLVYVLVVEGDAANYQDWLRRSQSNRLAVRTLAVPMLTHSASMRFGFMGIPPSTVSCLLVIVSSSKCR